MHKWIGLALLLVGVAIISASVLIGGAFSGLFLLGFVMSLGREYGKELWQFGSWTLGSFLVGFVLVKIGLKLRSLPATLRA